MPRPWVATIDIKGILRATEETDVFAPDEVEKVGKDIALLIYANIRKLPVRLRDEFQKIAEEFEEAAETRDMEEVNFMLDQLYELGDNVRVFLGPGVAEVV